MIFFLITVIFFICLYLISNLFYKSLALDNFERPIFSLGILVLMLNYLYFQFDVEIKLIFFLFLILSILGFIFFFFKSGKSNHFKEILFAFLIIVIPLSILGSYYGEQFYIFRGNIHDHFVYLSTGLSFNSFTHSELIMFNENYPENLSHEYYLKHVLALIYYRPSIQLFLGFLLNFNFVDVIEVSYLFKTIATVLVSLGAIKFFFNLTKNLKSSLYLSIGFVFSFYYFYNYEIDAYSLIFSLPFLFLIFAYIIELKENLDQRKSILFFKIGFICSIYFIIYPNGAAIIFIPIFIYVLYLFKFTYDKKKYLINLVFAGILFFLIVLPTYQSSLMYLINSEIPIGLMHKNDFWGYYGAFIFGKDNPIHDLNVVSQIKEQWSVNKSIIKILPQIISINLENNSLFLLNIVPSIFGFYHFSLSKNYELLNYVLIIILLFLNLIIVKRIYKNLISYFKKNQTINVFLLINFIFFIIFFLILVSNNLLWSSIKLYFILSPLIFILITLDFSKSIPKFNKKFILILLIMLPIYKYSEFNYGIGKLDSFPSIIKKNSKMKFVWSINKNDLKECKNLQYKLNENFHKIYVSLIYKNLKLNYDGVNCNIEIDNEKFKINKI